MNLPQNIKAFLKQIPIKNMTGEQIFVAIAFFLSGGKREAEIEIKAIKDKWSKTLIGKSYNSGFANRAQGHIDPCGKGKICMTDEGIEYIKSLILEVPVSVTKLTIFKRGSAHSFDKFLREIFKSAKKGVDIADTFVAGNVFDTLLDEIPKVVPIRFLYGNDTGGFVSKSARFAKEYNFQNKVSQQFHDRFLIVDSRGFIIGPSLKNAADKKPATLVVLDDPDSKKLIDLYEELWNEK